VKGDEWAYTAGVVAIALGTTIVFFLFPGKQREQTLLCEYSTLDTASDAREIATRAGPV